MAGGGCTLPGGNGLEESEQVFESRDGYVRAIESFLKGKPRDKVTYTAEELREASRGKGRFHGNLGVYNQGSSDYGTSGAILTKGYDEDFRPEKFTLLQLHKIYKFLDALENDPQFRKELGTIIYLIRSRRKITLYGLKRDNTRGTFTVDYGQSEPGGAIVEEDGRVRVLFSEPEYVQGPTSYIGTHYSVRAADLGTFHGHPNSPGPTAQDIVSSLIVQTDSFIISDMGNVIGAYRANLNFLSGQGKGLDLTTTSLPIPKYGSFEDVPIVP